MDKMIDTFFAETFHTVPDIFNAQSVPKSDEEAKKYRNAGNSDFISQNHFDALINYNKSIAFAETKEVASLGYGNRSAVYFELKLFDECIKNIQYARLNEYPEDKMQKLIEREDKCKDLMAESMDVAKDNFWDFFKLSYPANEKIPFVANCVEMRRNKKFGRGIYAKEDLKAGDILCIEEPIFSYADGDNAYMRCYNCFKANAMNLIPCDYTGSMMFCSVACKDKLRLKAINMTDILSADVKMLSDIAKSFGNSKNLKNVPLKDFKKTIFDFDLNDPEDPEYKQKLIMCLLSLSTNDRRVDHVCKSRNYVNENDAHHILSIFNLNFQKVNVNDGHKKFIGGWCIPLFASLINHSCVRNVHPIMVDNKLVTIVLEPIKAGNQLFFCYPDPGAIRSTKIREGLEEIQDFKCSCKICARGGKPFFEDVERLINSVNKKHSSNIDWRQYQQSDISLKINFAKINDQTCIKLNDYPLNSFFATHILETVAYQCSFPFFSK